jgi:hypothetical protein
MGELAPARSRMKPRSVIPLTRRVILSAKFHFKIALITIVNNRLHVSSGLLTKVDDLPRLLEG